MNAQTQTDGQAAGAGALPAVAPTRTGDSAPPSRLSVFLDRACLALTLLSLLACSLIPSPPRAHWTLEAAATLLVGGAAIAGATWVMLHFDPGEDSACATAAPSPMRCWVCGKDIDYPRIEQRKNHICGRCTIAGNRT